MHAQESFRSWRGFPSVTCKSLLKVGSTALTVKKPHAGKCQAQVDPVSTPESKYLQVQVEAVHGTTQRAYLCWQTLKTALAKVFLHSARFLEEWLFFVWFWLFFIWEPLSFWWKRVPHVRITFTSDKNTVLKEWQQPQCWGKSVRNLQRIHLNKYHVYIASYQQRADHDSPPFCYCICTVNHFMWCITQHQEILFMQCLLQPRHLRILYKIT